MSFAPTTESRLALAAHDNGTCYTELVLGMEGLVKMMANERLNGGDSQLREELESEGKLALCEAAMEYRAGVGRFSTFAGQRINRAMVSYLRTVSGMGTEWTARRQQETRQNRQWLTVVLGWEPDEFEQTYVSGSEPVPESNTVPIDDAQLPSIAPEAEDGAEKRFHARWLSLPLSDRVLVERAEQMGMVSHGVSLTCLAKSLGERRTTVERRLVSALGRLV